MMIYLMRHAEAVPGADDAARELSGKGRQQARRMGRLFARQGWKVDLAFSSPLVRAVQTLELVLQASGLADAGLEAQETPQLLNDVRSRDFGAWLLASKRRLGILLVGHAPSLPAHAAWLLGSRREDAFRMGKAHIAAFETDRAGSVQLRFFVGPKLL